MKKIFVFFCFFIFVGFEASSVVIDEIVFVGNREVPSSVLQKQLKSAKGSTFSIENLAQDQNILNESKYIDSCKVTPKVDDGKLMLVFEIVESKDVVNQLKKSNIYSIPEMVTEGVEVVKEISIEGNLRVDEEEIKKEIPLAVGEVFSANKFKLGKINLEEKGVFSNVNGSFHRNGQDIYINYEVRENVIIGNEIIIRGSTVFDEEELKRLVKQKPNSVINNRDLRESLEAISDKYAKEDYVGVEVGVGDDEEGNLVLTIIEPIVDKISIKKRAIHPLFSRLQKLKTKDYVILREIELEYGKPIKQSSLMKSIYNLRRLGYFGDGIDFRLENIDENGQRKEAVFEFMEEKSGVSGSLTFGQGMSMLKTNSGKKGLNVSLSGGDNNFMGNGQKFSLSGEWVKGVSYQGKVGFHDPWVKGTKGLALGFDLYRKYSNSSDVKNETSYLDNNVFSGFKVEIGQKIKKDWKILFQNDLRVVESRTSRSEFFASYYENLKNKDKDLEKGLKETFLVDKFYENRVSGELVMDKSNNYLDPTNGVIINVKLEYNKRLKGNFVKIDGWENKPDILSSELGLRIYHEWFSKNVFAIKAFGAVGHCIAKGLGPFNEGFCSLGGEQSVRGFSEGEQKGMKAIFLNIENRTIVAETNEMKLEAAVFFDIGMATNYSFNEFLNFDKYLKSAGVSFRLKNFMMPFNITVAKPMGKSLSFSVGISTPF